MGAAILLVISIFLEWFSLTTDPSVVSPRVRVAAPPLT